MKLFHDWSVIVFLTACYLVVGFIDYKTMIVSDEACHVQRSGDE